MLAWNRERGGVIPAHLGTHHWPGQALGAPHTRGWSRGCITPLGSPEAGSGGRAVSGSCVPVVFVISCASHCPLSLARCSLCQVQGATERASSPQPLTGAAQHTVIRTGHTGTTTADAILSSWIKKRSVQIWATLYISDNICSFLHLISS